MPRDFRSAYTISILSNAEWSHHILRSSGCNIRAPILYDLRLVFTAQPPAGRRRLCRYKGSQSKPGDICWPLLFTQYSSFSRKADASCNRRAREAYLSRLQTTQIKMRPSGSSRILGSFIILMCRRFLGEANLFQMRLKRSNSKYLLTRSLKENGLLTGPVRV